MTLRDYFAAKAMHAAIAKPSGSYSVPPPSTRDIAEYAYRMADAMLIARES